jgi:hypothetical protein
MNMMGNTYNAERMRGKSIFDKTELAQLEVISLRSRLI